MEAFIFFSAWGENNDALKSHLDRPSLEANGMVVLMVVVMVMVTNRASVRMNRIVKSRPWGATVNKGHTTSLLKSLRIYLSSAFTLKNERFFLRQGRLFFVIWMQQTNTKKTAHFVALQSSGPFWLDAIKSRQWAESAVSGSEHSLLHVIPLCKLQSRAQQRSPFATIRRFEEPSCIGGSR